MSRVSMKFHDVTMPRVCRSHMCEHGLTYCRQARFTLLRGCDDCLRCAHCAFSGNQLQSVLRARARGRTRNQINFLLYYVHSSYCDIMCVVFLHPCKHAWPRKCMNHTSLGQHDLTHVFTLF